MTNTQKRVLVLCTGNSCRSIITEALINHFGKKHYLAFSAGSHPTGQVHLTALQTLSANNIDFVQPRSKSWVEFSNDSFDYIITVCDEATKESCPVFLGTGKRLHWSTPDPANATGTPKEITQSFQEVFEQLKKRVMEFIA